MNEARQILEEYCDILADPMVDLRIAAQQTRAMRNRYTAPHYAMQQIKRKKTKRRANTTLAPRLFKGHRP